MLIRLCVVAALLLLPSPVRAADHPRDQLSVALLAAGTVNVGLSAWDAGLTYRAVRSHQAHEVNPLIVPFVEAHGIGPAMVGKLAIDTGTIVGMSYMAKRWPGSRRAVLGGYIAQAAIKGFVIRHNLRVLREQR